MKLENIIEIMEKAAPLFLKESYDNVGLMVGDRNSDITKILVALDCTKEVIEEAKEIGAELILTHHPLIFNKPSSITEDTLQGEKIRALIKNDISLYSSHTNWDKVKNGLNDEFVTILGFNSGEILEHDSNMDGSGVGRKVVLAKPEKVENIIKTIKEKVNLKTIRIVGDINKEVRTIGFINGSGEDYFEMCIKEGIELVITGDTTYHYASDFKEKGLIILDIGHFNCEWPVLINLSNKVLKPVKDEGIEIIISKKSTDPYEFI